MAQHVAVLHCVFHNDKQIRAHIIRIICPSDHSAPGGMSLVPLQRLHSRPDGGTSSSRVSQRHILPSTRCPPPPALAAVQVFWISLVQRSSILAFHHILTTFQTAFAKVAQKRREIFLSHRVNRKPARHGPHNCVERFDGLLNYSTIQCGH